MDLSKVRIGDKLIIEVEVWDVEKDKDGNTSECLYEVSHSDTQYVYPEDVRGINYQFKKGDELESVVTGNKSWFISDHPVDSDQIIIFNEEEEVTYCEKCLYKRTNKNRDFDKEKKEIDDEFKNFNE